MSALYPAKRTGRVGFVFYRGDSSENSTRYGGFVKRLQKTGELDGLEVEYFALEELIYEINGELARVYQPGKKYELGECDFVYIKSWSKNPDRAAALANFLEAKGIRYADSLVAGKGTSKLTTHFRLWKSGVSVVPSIFVRASNLETVSSSIGYPSVVKAVHGQKGQDNYLVHTKQELLELSHKFKPDVDVIAQPFIKNEGDYRTQVYGYEVRMGMLRVGKGDTHLNNTSAGGQAFYRDVAELPSEVVDLSRKAAMAMELEVCGVDVVVSSETDQAYVLEVNQGSQVVTGLFSKENSSYLAKYIASMSQEPRYIRGHKSARRLKVIGRYARVALPDLGIESIDAKVDTGAHVSSLHAENITLLSRNGVACLQFEIPTEQGRIAYSTEDFGEVDIRNAHGVTTRYTISTKINVQGTIVKTRLNLSDRGELKYPLLLGRRFLRGRFLVNVEIGIGAKK